MAIIVKNNTFSAGAVIVASEHNANFDTVFNDYNGNVTNANCAAGMALDLSKLDLSDSATFTGAITFDDANISANNGLALLEGTAPATAAGEMKIYTKDTSGQPELFAREESSGDEVQLTSGGSVAGQGVVLQVVNVQSSTVQTATGNIPDDNTTPQLSEAPVFASMDTAITPTAGSTLLIRVVISLGVNAAAAGVVCLFNADSHATNALVCAAFFSSGAGNQDTVALEFSQAEPNSGSATTYKVGFGGLGAERVGHLNSDSAASTLNGTNVASVTVTEIAA